MVKNVPAMQETWVWSLDWEDPLEKGTHGDPLQFSGLENSMDRRASWATVHGVTNSWTHLKRLRMQWYSHLTPDVTKLCVAGL